MWHPQLDCLLVTVRLPTLIGVLVKRIYSASKQVGQAIEQLMKRCLLGFRLLGPVRLTTWDTVADVAAGCTTCCTGFWAGTVADVGAAMLSCATATFGGGAVVTMAVTVPGSGLCTADMVVCCCAR
jgi:hypothetical protein